MRSAFLSLAGLCLLTGSVSFGCGPRQGQTDTMMSAVRGFNENIRWRRFPEAAARIPAAEREPFLDERETLAEDLRVDDYEIMRVKVDKGNRKARIQVRYMWHRDSNGAVHRTTALQQWERKRSRWYMAQERRVRGKPMPGLAEPLPKKKRKPRPKTAQTPLRGQ